MYYIIVNNQDKALPMYVTDTQGFTSLPLLAGVFENYVAGNIANKLEKEYNIKLDVEIAK